MKIPLLFVIGSLLAFSSGAGAQINNEMTRMFGQTGNATAPGIAKGASRGVITGGNITLRNPIVQPELLSFDPPRFAAGCGGIDLHGGNLSFPSAQSFVSTARAVAANASGYAFKLALSALCKECESMMSEIQDLITELNLASKNSCELAQNAIDATIGDKITNSASALGERIGVISGFSRDLAEARGTPATSKTAEVIAASPEAAEALTGNPIWKAVNVTGAANWLRDDKSIKEEIMSLIGTVVICVPGVDGCTHTDSAGRTGDPVAKTYPPTLRLRDLLAGNTDGLDGQSSEPLRVAALQCRDDDCLNVTVNENHSLGKSMVQLIIDTFIGPDGVSGEGIIEKWSTPAAVSAPLTEREIAIIARTGDIGSRVNLILASRDRLTAETFVRDFAPDIAIEILYRDLRQVLHIVNSGLQGYAGPGTADASALIANAQQTMHEDYEAIRMRVTQNDAMYQRYVMLTRSAEVRSNLTAPASGMPVGANQ